MRPTIIVGYAGVLLAALTEIQPEGSVIFVEEPDVVRKRGLREQVPGLALTRELVEWEYGVPGEADEFHRAHPGLEPAAVIPVVEYATPFAARLAELYGLPGTGFVAAQILRDKRLLRRASAAAGIANPASVPVTSPADVLAFLRERSGPVVLKPANRQASVGTRVIRRGEAGAGEVEAAWAACVTQDEGVFVSDRPMALAMLAEQYVDGREYSVEMLVRDGQPLFANVTDKFLFDGPHPVERAHRVPADMPADLTAALHEQTIRVLAAIGFRTGIVHCEWIVADGVPHLVECAGRLPGGGILDIIQLAYPVELLRAYLAVMRGEEPGELPRQAVRGAAVRFLTAGPGVVQAIHGVETARRAPGVVLVHVGATPGEEYGGVRSSWDRAGVVMSTGDSAADALELAEAAAGAIRIETGQVAERRQVVGGRT